MTEFRKQWTWPHGLGDKVYYMIRKWDNQYNNTGRIFKARAAANARYGMELPDTIVEVRMHELTFTYSEIRWLNSILQTEDKNTRQAVIIARAVELFEKKQNEGRAAPGMALPFDMAFTHDEVKYIRKLLECIGLYLRPTPSEKIMQKKDIAKANW